MREFLDMGGYAAFVWPAYAITLTAAVLNVYWARAALRRAQEQARRRLSMRSEP